MKKLLLLIFFSVLFISSLYAESRDSGRQQSDFYHADVPYPRTTIKSTQGTVFGITMSAVAAKGWVAVYDLASAGDITSSTEPKIELWKATQYNTEPKDFNNGLEFYNGIIVEGDNAQGIIYYY